MFIAPDTVALSWKSASILAHELAHAIDYQLGLEVSQRATGVRETIATAVETLLMRQLCYSKATSSVVYAHEQGGSNAIFESSRERIEVIYQLIYEQIKASVPAQA